jgi:RNA polymerase sigma-70 factor (ECF subfamily)
VTRTFATAPDVGERGFDLEASARRHYADILAYLRSRTRNPEAARDLAQETFLQAYRSRRRFDPERGDLREWLFGIARNVSASAARRGEALPTLQAIVERAWSEPPETTGEDARASALGRCLEALTARTRDILRLLYDESMSHAEIGERLGLGLSAVKVAACRARQTLAECIRRRLGGQP